MINSEVEAKNVSGDGAGSIAPRRLLFHHLLPILAYSVAALAYTWPLVLHLNDQVPSALVVDRDQNLWNFWWFRYSLLTLHHNPFYDPLIYWPDHQAPGVPLWLHIIQPLNMVVGLVLQQFLSLSATYNLVVLASFVGAGYGAYLLVSYITASRWAGLVSGLAFAAAPFRTVILGQATNLYTVEFIPFYLLCLLHLRDAVSEFGLRSRATLKWLTGATFFLALITLTDWYLLICVLVLTGLLALAYLWYARRKGRRWLAAQWAALGLMAVLWGVVCSPLIIPTVQEAGDTSLLSSLPEVERVRNSIDLITLFVAPDNQNLEAPLTNQILANFPSYLPTCDTDLNQCLRRRGFVGYTTILLAIVGTLGWWRRRSGYWLGAALFSALLTLGPVLQIGTYNTNIPMLFLLLERLPFMSIMRAPDRFMMAVVIATAVLAGLGVAWLQQRGRAARWLAAGLSLAMVVEFFAIPLTLAPVTASPFFSQLGADPAQYAILELPLTNHYAGDHQRNLNQAFHHKAIIGAYLSRQVIDKFRSVVDVHDWFDDYKLPPSITADHPADALITMLNDYQFRYIVLYKGGFVDANSFQQADAHFSQLFTSIGATSSRVFEDDSLVAYRVPEQAPRPLALLDSGWLKAEQSNAGPHRWIDGDNATMRLIAPQAGSYTFSFSASSFARPRRLALFLGGTQVWQQQIPANEIKSYQVTGLKLNPGTDYLQLQVLDGYDSPAKLDPKSTDTRNLSVNLADVRLTQP
jgi:hypothetical protein